MTPERWQQVDQLFHEALACDPARRADFLAHACADDEPLRLEVESLISSHEEADSFIETPAGDVAAGLLGAHESAFEPGQQIENYRIVRQLGSGGMGEVYLADDLRLNRQIALKLLPPKFTINPDRVRRFEREARAASALNHPNIVTIFEIGKSNSAHFIVTEFVDGKTLRQLINEKPFRLSEALSVVIQVADALTGAHAAGIIHRDIKPENIMIRRDGYVKILDFGLAKLTDLKGTEAESEMPTLLQSNPGLVMGTVQYMSPEQARGKKVDVRTDVWSLGIVLYELLAGRVPFSGETPSHVMVSLMENEAPILTDCANVPPELDRIVTKAMSKNPKERYQTTRQLADDLKNFKRELQSEQLKGLLKAVPTGQAIKGAQHSAPAPSTIEMVAPRSQPTHEAKTPIRGLTHRKALIFVALVVLIAGPFAVTYLFINRNRPSSKPSGTKSIAVLPVRPVNTANRDEIYELGIADSLIQRLNSMKGFIVRPLDATRKYAALELDPIAVGKEQQVDYVLVANYQIADGKIKVTAQLFDVATGHSEQTYQSEKDTTNVFATQDAIAAEVTNILMTRLAVPSSPRLAGKRGTTNEEAYRLYLQAMYLYSRRTERASRQAVDLLDQAVRLDPNYALAWAGKAHAHRYAANLGRDTDTHAEYKKSIEAINRALSLDDQLSEAYSALCENKYYYEFDFVGAETACQRAVALDPNSSLAREIYGRYLYHRGRFSEGISELETAVDLQPTSLFSQRNLGIAFYYAGFYEKAKAQFKRVIGMDESFTSAYSWLRNVFEIEGNYSEAFDWFIKAQAVLDADAKTIQLYTSLYNRSGYHAVLREYVRRFDKSINQYYVGALLHADTGNKDMAFEYLEIAYQRREWGINSLLIERRLGPLRGDPRFDDLVRRIGLK